MMDLHILQAEGLPALPSLHFVLQEPHFYHPLALCESSGHRGSWFDMGLLILTGKFRETGLGPWIVSAHRSPSGDSGSSAPSCFSGATPLLRLSSLRADLFPFHFFSHCSEVTYF